MGYPHRAKSKYGRNRWWHNIVKKHDYIIEIVEVGLKHSEAIKKEIELIALYGRKDKGLGELVNLTDGGEGTIGYHHTPEMKEKLRLSSTGNKNAKGARSDEFKERNRQFKLGGSATEETKKRMSESHKGKKMPEGALAKAWETRRKNKLLNK